MREALKTAQFGYESDVRLEELRFVLQPDGSLLVTAPTGKKISKHFIRRFMASQALLDTLKLAEGMFSPFMGGGDIPPTQEVIGRTITAMRAAIAQATGR